ncbi:sec7 domain containing protein [Grosmannia clavigera kw1407]|uniref:Sec7 domain containing protein n=1 Tax=Grosmannia clavigera (strain kw1407 / UAMH 11150) TaxID=655863 RepID=F0X907_GROCL|nr:sec7 domain containing protein [Grosmannia clavigera kw1407]EFX05550.1 sec7 domain containing protein [Grosmannia clavigera kw1407]
MHPDHSRPSQRRRPDLTINTSRATAKSTGSVPPSPPTRKAAVSGARGGSPNFASTATAATATAAATTAPTRAITARRSSHAPKPASSDATAAESGTYHDYHPHVNMAASRENGRTTADMPHMPGQRDSHDLSLPSRHVRDSLVSNMLLSLDQFSMGQLGDPLSSAGPSRTGNSFDDRLYSISTSGTGEDLSRINTIPPSVARGAARHGYSYSSDYEVADDASRVSGSIHSRGHRSNSSSGFQSSLGRINSMRESLHRGSQPGTPRMMHSRGGKASKSSSTNSIDAGGYVQVLGSQRWAHGFGRRSSSFDMGQQRPARSMLGNGPPPSLIPGSGPIEGSSSGGGGVSGLQPWHIDFSNAFFNENYDDAAPTPTVPGGPRKLNSVPSMPSIPFYQSASSDSMGDPRASMRPPERRRSVRSSKSATVGRQPPAKFASTAPPLPVYDIDSAPAPHIGYEKTKDAASPAMTPAQQQLLQQQQQQQQQQYLQLQQQQQQQQQHQKPGFFRRVFGSFRDTVAGSEQSSSNTAAPANSANSAFALMTAEAAGSRVPAGKSQSTPPSRDSHHSTHATIQKKPSGFFRRRKKSVSEIDGPPPLPAAFVQQASPQPPPPPPPSKTQPAVPPAPPLKPPALRDDRLLDGQADSPATSLRRAMSPYLKYSSSFPNTLAGKTGSPLMLQSDDLYDAEPEQTAAQGAEADDMAARAVRGFSPDYEPSPDATIRSVEPEPTDPHHRLATPLREQPNAPHPARSGSFLSDNSDDEDSPRRVAKKTLAEQGVKKRGSRSSLVASIMGDFSLLSPTTAHQRSKERTGSRATQDDAESRGSRLSLPVEGPIAPRSSTRGSDTAIPRMPSLQFDAPPKSKPVPAPIATGTAKELIDEPEFVIGDPTEDDRNKALNIFEGNEDFIQRGKAAAWMGEEGPVRQRTLQAYMDLYNFQNQSIVKALREVCRRLILRAETQQVDRILVSFSKRWCTCNPNHGFKSMDVVHTACYSIMLLNTDLHMADIESKMTKSQFIKNTMTSIRQTAGECSPTVSKRPSILPGRGSAFSSSNEGSGKQSAMSQAKEYTTGLGLSASSFLPPRSGSSQGHHHDEIGPLISTPFDGTMHAWEAQMELVLRDIYSSIRDERLPLFGADNSQASNQNGLSVKGMLKRTPSVLSKTPSESQMSTRGRVTDQNGRASSSRWTSKSRSRARVTTSSGGNNGFNSSRTSFDDANSMWSPTASSATWSRQSLGRTQASMSMESFNSSWGRGDYQQSIGFANALSQAIIREDGLSAGDEQSVHQKDHPLLDDESLELAGPPWVKEGLVVHKHHLGGTDKKAKDRTWNEVFVVVQKGQISLFSFTPNKSMRSKNRGRGNGALAPGAVVGGGNWQDNATNLGTFGLKQSLASALPPPGYSRQRPNVWALSLPTGAVHLFQVGTPEICKEFVTTANYWSARLSTHPLVGGISNMEFGWSDAVVNNSLVSAINHNGSNSALPAPPASSSGVSLAGGGSSGSGLGHGLGLGANNNSSTGLAQVSRPGSAAAGRTSLQSRGSFRSSSFDFGHVRNGSASSANGTSALHGGGSSSRHGKLPGDRIHIADWAPPTQSMRPSHAAEAQQLQTLLAYVKSIEDELQVHNGLRSPMLLAFSPRGQNAQKALANWERKSAYLLREIVKYHTYVDCLSEAARRRGEIYHERDIARRAARGEDGEPTDVEDDGMASDEDDSGLESEDEDYADHADETLRA